MDNPQNKQNSKHLDIKKLTLSGILKNLIIQYLNCWPIGPQLQTNSLSGRLWTLGTSTTWYFTKTSSFQTSYKMESEKPTKRLRLEAKTDEGEEMLRLKEKVEELENLVEEGKSQIKEAESKVLKLQKNS